MAQQHLRLHQSRTLSSKKKGLPCVRTIRSCLIRARLGSSPSNACRTSGALAGGKGPAEVACNRSCCPSRAGTRADS